MKITCINNINFPQNNEFEVIERKGIGHPDTVADAIAERISVEYSQYCLTNFGVVLHHNVDKFAILGGLINLEDWGKAEMIKPVRAFVNGRISSSFGNHKIPVEEICQHAIKTQLAVSLPYLDTSKYLKIINNFTTYSKNPIWFNPRNISDFPEYKDLRANDTSSVISYWPLTLGERLTLGLEGFFYDKNQKPRFKEFGQDIKVMVVRRKDFFDITLCVPFFIKHIKDEASYWKLNKDLESELSLLASDILGKNTAFRLQINTQIRQKGLTLPVRSGYFVATGGALDYGEEGLVGRGNDRLGIISAFRPHSMEAACGKNPIYHVGKVLGLAADVIVKEIADKFNCKAEICIVSNIGDPLLSPNNIIVNTSRKISQTKVNSLVDHVLTHNNWSDIIINKQMLIPKTGNLY